MKTIGTLLMLGLVLFAAPVQADTFRIELDYMVDNSATNPHTHKPQQAEIDAVVQMFACHGHTLIVDVDDALPHYRVLKLDPNNRNNFFGYSGVDSSYGKLKNQYYDHASDPGWHYAIFAHQYEWSDVDNSGNVFYYDSGSSGLGQRPGEFLVVTLGAFSGQIGTPFDRASSLAHEFGHNLGLSHCGQSDCSAIKDNPPNLPSIMSYNYQLEGVRSGMLCNRLIPQTAGYLFKEMDYSSGRMCHLSENNLDETIGTMMKAVDWNCDTVLQTSIAKDLSSDGPTWCSNTGSLDLLLDVDEWSNIHDTTADKALAKNIQPVLTPCITSDEMEQQRRNKAVCAQPTLATESCLSAETVYVDPTWSSGSTGWCEFPYQSVNAAASSAPSNSALFLRPGTYSESGSGSLVVNQDVILYAPKSAVIR
jgi:hypothetical protein